MPYLSHNYRFQAKPRHQNVVEMTVFVISSALAILITLFLLGWWSTSSLPVASEVDTTTKQDIIAKAN